MNAISAARAYPTIRGNNHVPPLSGKIPLFANPGAIFALSAAIRMSHPKAMSSPYPAAPPFRAHTTGVSMPWRTIGGAPRRSNSTMFASVLSSTPRDSVLPACEPRSSPAQNARPAPVRMMHRTSGFVSASRSFSDSNWSILPEMVFMRPGAFNVIVPM